MKDGHLNQCRECVQKAWRESAERAKQRKNEIRQSLFERDGVNPSVVDVKREEERQKRYAIPKTLDLFTPRELMAELKDRGYVWTDMTFTQKVNYKDI